MRICKLLLICVFVILLTGQAFAFDGVDQDSPLLSTQQKIFNAINQYWLIQETFIAYMESQSEESETAWLESVENHEQTCMLIGHGVVTSAKKSHFGELELLSAIYKSLHEGSRISLYPAVKYLRFHMVHAQESFLSEEMFRDYFPGYGYTEPGFKYRKGRELDREFKGVTWQYEEHSISSTLTVNLTVTLDVVDILRRLLTGGFIRNLNVSEPYQMHVGGQPMFVCNVSFQRITSITTKTNRKFEINKIWFELLRAKSSVWGSADWELVGKTYEILHEPTGEDVVTDIQAK